VLEYDGFHGLAVRLAQIQSSRDVLDAVEIDAQLAHDATSATAI
jgi:hypothetical protein